MSNNRIYYACQSVQLYPPIDIDTTQSSADNGDAIKGGTPETIQGLQSVGINTNFNLEPVYQLGQLSLYDNYEEIPEVEISLNKVLDGRATLFQSAMGEGSLTSLQNRACGVRLTLYPDTVQSATGTVTSQVECAPAYLSSVTYNFPSEGNFTEEVQLVSNNKTWESVIGDLDTAPTETDAGSDPGILRRQQLDLVNSTLPTGVGGGAIPVGYKIQSITVSLNLGRESIFNLGERAPSFRYINFPVEITSEFEVIARGGDLVGADESGDACQNPKALSDKTIIIALCDGTTMNLGDKNKLTSVNYTGGDTGGGNATITYSYQTFNDFTFGGPSVSP